MSVALYLNKDINFVQDSITKLNPNCYSVFCFVDLLSTIQSWSSYSFCLVGFVQKYSMFWDMAS